MDKSFYDYKVMIGGVDNSIFNDSKSLGKIIFLGVVVFVGGPSKAGRIMV